MLGVVEDAYIEIELVEHRDEGVDWIRTRCLYLHGLVAARERRVELSVLVVNRRDLRRAHPEATPRL